jgi:hypothetical protein
VFSVNSGGNLTINGVTITNGRMASAGGGISNGGGGIYNFGTLTLTNSTVSGNTAAGFGGGGGIYNGGTMTLTNSTVSGNMADGGGGGILNNVGGTTTLTNSTVSGNMAGGHGGGIYDGGTLTLTNSAISDNTAAGDGGGIANDSDGTMTLTNSTVSGNTANEGFGGGIANAGTITLTNSTVSGNTAANDGGGGIYNDGGTMTLRNSTVSGNMANGGGGIVNAGGTLNLTSVTVTNNSATSPGCTGCAGGISNFSNFNSGTANLNNTIVAGNTVAFASNPPDFFGAISSTSSFNIIGNNQDTTGITNGTNGNQVGTPASPIDPRLAPLANNGGATQTHALLFGSPALDKGNSFTLTTDQRGFARPFDNPSITNATGGDGADIGAFEVRTDNLQPDLTVTKTHTGNFTQGDTGKTYSITVTNSGGAATNGTVGITDTLPGGLAATGINGTGWNCNFSNLTCTRSDALAGGSSYPAITLTVNVASNAPTSVTNIVTVSGGGETNTSNNTAGDQTTINATPRYSISGAVTYGITPTGQAAKFVPGVSVNATGASSVSALTTGTGDYSLANLISGGNYLVTPSKSGNVNGISSFDASLVARRAANTVTLTPNQMIAADASGNGAVSSFDASLIARTAAGIANTGIAGQWKFAPASRRYSSLTASQTGQNYDAILMGEVSGNWLAPSGGTTAGSPSAEETAQSDRQEEEHYQFKGFDPVPVPDQADSQSEVTAAADAQQATVNVSLPANSTASNGTTVIIPVTVGDTTGAGIFSFDFTVTFDPNVLQLASPAFDTTGTVAGAAGFTITPNAGTGQLTISGFGSQALSGAGTLINLRFTVVGTSGTATGTTGLTFTSFVFNEGDPAAATTPGRFSVTGTTAASVSVSGRVTARGRGRGISNAVVHLTSQNGEIQTAKTNRLGYYTFRELAVGETYIFNVFSKRYQFDPKVINLTEDLTEFDFTAQ